MSREITLTLTLAQVEYLAQTLGDNIENLAAEGWSDEDLEGPEELLQQLQEASTDNAGAYL
jgi:hypothetical protein